MREVSACEIACVWKCALIKLYACENACACESACVGKCMRVEVRACKSVCAWNCYNKGGSNTVCDEKTLVIHQNNDVILNHSADVPQTWNSILISLHTTGFQYKTTH